MVGEKKRHQKKEDFRTTHIAHTGWLYSLQIVPQMKKVIKIGGKKSTPNLIGGP